MSFEKINRWIIAKFAKDGYWHRYWGLDPKKHGVSLECSAWNTYCGNIAGIKESYGSREEALNDLTRINQTNPLGGYGVCPVLIYNIGKNPSDNKGYVIVKNACDGLWEFHWNTDPKLGVSLSASAHLTYSGTRSGIKEKYSTKEEALSDLFLISEINPSGGYEVCPVTFIDES